MGWRLTRDRNGMPMGLDYFPERSFPLTCAQCGGDLLAGRNESVCEKGCAIRHETPVDWLEKHHPERKIGHNTWGVILKDVKEGARKLAMFDKTEAT